MQEDLCHWGVSAEKFDVVLMAQTKIDDDHSSKVVVNLSVRLQETSLTIESALSK